MRVSARTPLTTPARESRDWDSFVASQLQAGWRGDEWRPELMLFTGRRDTSTTLAFTCATPDCGEPSRTKLTPCYECQQELKTFVGDRSAFRRTHTANRGWTGTSLARCRITHAGERCERTATSRGVCRSHWSMWLKRQQTGCSFDEFVAACDRIYPRRAHCRVTGCEHEIVSARWVLCAPHDQQFSVGGRGSKTHQALTEFLRTARPLVRIHQFSLAGMPPRLRAEILYVLQQRDAEGFCLDPTMVRIVVKKCDERGVASLLDFPEAEVAALARSNTAQRSFLRSARLHLTRLQVRYGSYDVMNGDVWDVALLGLHASGQRRYPATRGQLDFTEIPVPWVRTIVKEWVRQTEPDVQSARHMVRATSIACAALTVRVGGADPSRLRLADMTAVVRHINELVRADGQLYSAGYRAELLGLWRTLIEFGRSAALMNDVPGDFAVLRFHRTDKQEPAEEKAGKALPVAVIRALDGHIAGLRPITERTVVGWTADDYALMYQTMYWIFRNTGRRLDEVMSLKRDCLRFNDNGDPSLVYDNRKARRLGRWLHIDRDTASVIEGWQQHVDQLDVLPDLRTWLFPSPATRRQRKRGHYWGDSFIAAFNAWKHAISPIHHGGLAEDGSPREFDKNLIHTHAFRHTYAQRHADAGTPVDVLRELMDHRSIDTTMGYYSVSLKRKAEAVRAVGALAVDRDGVASPETDIVAYQRKSVAVPFGNCTEPSNVKAGGEHCPIRFQCSGCDFYKPDPSFLPAIEEQIAKLRLEREHAVTVNAADWVLGNYDDQIAAFKKIATAMKALIERLPDEQRAALDEAGAVLRKTRAARTYLPLTVVDSKQANTRE